MLSNKNSGHGCIRSGHDKLTTLMSMKTSNLPLVKRNDMMNIEVVWLLGIMKNTTIEHGPICKLQTKSMLFL